jgi:hypothetical protein
MFEADPPTWTLLLSSTRSLCSISLCSLCTRSLYPDSVGTYGRSKHLVHLGVRVQTHTHTRHIHELESDEHEHIVHWHHRTKLYTE